MQGLLLGTTRATECAECGGLWLDAETLQRLCTQREQHSAIVGTLAGRQPPASPPTDTVRYIPCPHCSRLMNRVNFSKSSGVIMDACKAHGVWLDRGELQRVIGFIEGGGMEAQRAKEKEQLVQERRRLIALQSQPRGNVPAAAMHSSLSFGGSRDRRPETALDDVLRDIAGLFTGF